MANPNKKLRQRFRQNMRAYGQQLAATPLDRLPVSLQPASARMTNLAQMTSFIRPDDHYENMVVDAIGLKHYMGQFATTNPGVLTSLADVAAVNPLTTDPFERAAALGSMDKAAKLRMAFERMRESDPDFASKIFTDWHNSESGQDKIKLLRNTKGWVDPNIAADPVSRFDKIFVGGVSGGLAALNWGVENIQHAIRTLGYRVSEADGIHSERIAKEGLGGVIGGIVDRVGALFTSSRGWAQSWEDTAGDKWIPNIEEKDWLALPEHLRSVALLKAQGYADNEVISMVGDQRFNQFVTHSDAKHVLDNLESAKFSFGRHVAFNMGLEKNTKPFDFMSGTLDAVGTMTLDPLIALGKGAGALRSARYALKGGASTWDAVSATGRVRRAMNVMSKLENVDEVARLFPKLDNPVLLDEIGKRMAAGAWKGVDDVNDFFRTKAGQWAGGQGLASRIHQAPQLSALSSKLARANLKQTDLLDSVIASFSRNKATNWMAVGLRKIDGFSKQMPRAVRGTKNVLDLDDAENVRRLLQIAYPSSPKAAAKISKNLAREISPLNQMMDVFRAASPQGKRALIRGAMNDAFEILRVDKTFRDDFFKMWDEAVGTRIEGFGGKILNEAGQALDPRFLRGQNLVPMPDFREMAQGAFGGLRYNYLGIARPISQARKAFRAGEIDNTIFKAAIGTLDVTGTLTRAMVEKAMLPLMLLSGGFVVRNAGEEAFGSMMENGYFNFLRSRLQLSGKAARKSTILRSRALAAKSSGRMSLSAKLIRRAEKIEGGRAKDAFKEYLANRTNSTIRRFQGLAGDREVMKALDEWGDEVADRMIEDYGVGLLVGVTDNQAGTLGAYTEALSSGMTPASLEMAKQARKHHLNPGRIEGLYDNLSSMMDDPLTAKMIQATAGVKTARGARERLRKLLQSDEYAEFMAKSGWNSVDEAASAIQQYHWRLLRSEGDKGPQEILQKLSKGEMPDVEDFFRVPVNVLPDALKQKAFVPVGDSFTVSALMDRGFAKLDGGMRYISREPITHLEYAKAARELGRDYRDALKREFGEETGEQMFWDKVRETALPRALAQLDSPAVASQFAVFNKGLFPFIRAQEQFLKRWARRIGPKGDLVGNLQSLANLRKVQHSLNGLRDMGWVDRDPETGEEYFIYPLMPQIMGAIEAGLGALGLNVHMPRIIGRGKLTFVAAGLDNPLRPATNPLLGIALNQSQRKFDDFGALRTFNEIVQGEFASPGRGFLESFTPGPLRKILDGMNPEDKAGFQSLVLQMLQEAGIEQRIPNENASAGEKQRFIQDIYHKARVAYIVRAAVGFFGMTTPQLEVQNMKYFGDEFRELTRVHGFEDGLMEWIKRHPQGMVFAMGKNDRPTGANRQGELDLSKSREEFYRSNDEWFRNNASPTDPRRTAAASWFLPIGKTDDISFEILDEHTTLGLRRAKANEDLIDEFYARQANFVYYQSKRMYDQMKESMLPSDPRVRLLDDQWYMWQQDFNKQNPVAEAWRLKNSSAERHAVLSEVRRMLDDPNRPRVSHEAQLRGMLDLWDQHEQTLAAIRGRRDTGAVMARRQVQRALAEGAATLGPEAQLFYQILLGAEVDEDIEREVGLS